MISLLAIVGLIVVLWLLSKGLKKMGNTLTSFGDALIDIAADAQKNEHRDKKTQKRLDKMEDKIKSLKGDDDAAYREKVRREIDDLTK